MACTRYTTDRQKAILDRILGRARIVLVPSLSLAMPPRYRMSPKAISQHLIRRGYRMIEHNKYTLVGA
jgi:hypothetical protein